MMQGYSLSFYCESMRYFRKGLPSRVLLGGGGGGGKLFRSRVVVSSLRLFCSILYVDKVA